MTSENRLIILVLMFLLWWLVEHGWVCGAYARETGQVRRSWHLRPRTPKDCPQCQGDQPHSHPPQEIIPWSQVKSNRGRRKTISSAGQACPCETCVYFGTTEESVHAIVANGVEGKAEPIQQWLCQACACNCAGGPVR